MIFVLFILVLITGTISLDPYFMNEIRWLSDFWQARLQWTEKNCITLWNVDSIVRSGDIWIVICKMWLYLVVEINQNNPPYLVTRVKNTQRVKCDADASPALNNDGNHSQLLAIECVHLTIIKNWKILGKKKKKKPCGKLALSFLMGFVKRIQGQITLFYICRNFFQT